MHHLRRRSIVQKQKAPRQLPRRFNSFSAYLNVTGRSIIVWAPFA